MGDLDPWTAAGPRGQTLGGVLPLPPGPRRVGERTHSYQSGDEDVWGSSAIHRRDRRRTPAEAWRAWGDVVADPLDTAPRARDYATRPLRRGAHAPDPAYAARHPFPTYAQFGRPQLADALGRQFRWADGADAAALDTHGKRAADRLAYVRFPRGSRARIGFPEPRSRVQLVDLATGHLFAGEVAWIDGGSDPSAATGAVFLHDVADCGPAPSALVARANQNLPSVHQRKRVG